MAETGTKDMSAILIVDDEIATAKLLSDIIAESISSKIFVATSGDAAIALVKKIQNEGHYFIDTVISDIKMPGMTGHEFLLELVSGGIYAPVIFVSGFAEMDSALHALRLSAFDYLTKPVDPDHLVDCVRVALSKGKRLRAITSSFGSLQVANMSSGAKDDDKAAMAHIIEEAQKNWRMSYLLGLRNSKLGK